MYIVVLCVLILAYFAFILLRKDFDERKMVNNIVFAVLAFCCYIFLMIIVGVDAGTKDWNFLNTLPTANVSPFTFCIAPLILLLPAKVRRYFLTLISMLSLGMILSPILGCIRNAVIHYAFHPHFLLDYIAHVLISLWGIYIVISDQTVKKVKDYIISGSIIVGVAVVMMILNVIFDTSFFGLSLSGKHNIYNVVLVDNSYLSAFIYFAGLVVVLVAGTFYSKFLAWIRSKIFDKDPANATEG